MVEYSKITLILTHRNPRRKSFEWQFFKRYFTKGLRTFLHSVRDHLYKPCSVRATTIRLLVVAKLNIYAGT